LTGLAKPVKSGRGQKRVKKGVPKMTKNHHFLTLLTLLPLWQKGLFKLLISTSFSRPFWPVWPDRSECEKAKKGQKKVPKSPLFNQSDTLSTLLPLWQKGLFKLLISTSFMRPFWPVWPDRSECEKVKKGQKKVKKRSKNGKNG